jgi:hypothetical protein
MEFKPFTDNLKCPCCHNSLGGIKAIFGMSADTLWGLKNYCETEGVEPLEALKAFLPFLKLHNELANTKAELAKWHTLAANVKAGE